MEIVIIGSGNVAYHLAKAFKESNSEVKQLFGRNEEQLKAISSETGFSFSSTELAPGDLYIVAVSDAAVAEVSKLITNENSLVAHTSGSLSKEVLQGNYRKASFYPLQTFSKNKNLNYTEIPFFIEAENLSDENELMELAGKISDKVMKSTYEKRKYIHLTAVFACNFTNHLYARAKEISDSQDIPFSYFLPLIDETTEKIHFMDPKHAQTGPAVRDDRRILELHQELLEGESLEIYKTINKSIQSMYDL